MKKKHVYIVCILIVVLIITVLFSRGKGSTVIEVNDTIIDNVYNEITEEKVTPIFMYSEIPNNIKEIMRGKSMPKEANVSYEDLAYIKLTHYGFDENIHYGEMVVDKRLAEEVIDIFKELYDKKYPIDKVKLIDEYNANDNLSMNDNNSSAFCYRTIKGSNKISNHGKGMAIDINPFQNPHVIDGTTNPLEAYRYSNRTLNDKGIIKEGDACYNAFVKRGWTWGGSWTNPDYQHFEKVIN